MKRIHVNKATLKAHLNTRNDRCRQGAIKRGNLEKFNTLQDAVNKGYAPCKHCFPLEWK